MCCFVWRWTNNGVLHTYTVQESVVAWTSSSRGHHQRTCMAAWRTCVGACMDICRGKAAVSLPRFCRWVSPQPSRAVVSRTQMVRGDPGNLSHPAAGIHYTVQPPGAAADVRVCCRTAHLPPGLQHVSEACSAGHVADGHTDRRPQMQMQLSPEMHGIVHKIQFQQWTFQIY